MKKRERNEPDEPLDEIDEADLSYDAHGEGADELAPKRRPPTAAEWRAALVSLAASCGMFAFCLWRTGRGMYGHTLADSLTTIKWLMAMDIPVIMLGARALVATRPHEGRPIRGIAWASSALSFVVQLILANGMVVINQMLAASALSLLGNSLLAVLGIGSP